MTSTWTHQIYRFSDYFYSEKEIRKLKLDEIDGNIKHTIIEKLKNRFYWL